MGKNKKEYAEFRFYEKPGKEPVFALMGEGWNRDYGKGNGGLHFHNMVEIGYCRHGKGQVVLNKNCYDYEDGSFTFIPQNFPHTTNSDIRSHWEFLYFDAEELILEAFSGNIYKGEKIRTGINKSAFIFSAIETPHVGNLVLMIFGLISQGGDYAKDSIRCALVNIMLQVLRIKGEDAPPMDLENISRIACALEYIHDHYREDISICGLAECSHLSETHFRRLFQADMNMTPVEYINFIRVQAACDYMKKDDCHMETVASRVGYQTISTFNRNFKKIVGISPYQWKKQINTALGRVEKYQISAKRGWEF